MKLFSINGTEYSSDRLKLILSMGTQIEISTGDVSDFIETGVSSPIPVVTPYEGKYLVLCGCLDDKPKQKVILLSKQLLKKAKNETVELAPLQRTYTPTYVHRPQMRRY